MILKLLHGFSVFVPTNPQEIIPGILFRKNIFHNLEDTLEQIFKGSRVYYQ